MPAVPQYNIFIHSIIPFLFFVLYRSGNVLFSLDTATTKKRTEQYHSELDYLWQLLAEEIKKCNHNPPKDVVSKKINKHLCHKVGKKCDKMKKKLFL